MLKFVLMKNDGFEDPTEACGGNVPVRVLFEGAKRIHRIHLSLVSKGVDGTYNIRGFVYGNLEIGPRIVAIDAQVEGTLDMAKLEGELELIRRRSGTLARK